MHFNSGFRKHAFIAPVIGMAARGLGSLAARGLGAAARGTAKAVSGFSRAQGGVLPTVMNTAQIAQDTRTAYGKMRAASMR